jgi:hypothetical protein
MWHSLVDPVELRPHRAKTAKAGAGSPQITALVTTACLGAGGEILGVMELAHLPYKKGKTSEDYLGLRGLERMEKRNGAGTLLASWKNSRRH